MFRPPNEADHAQLFSRLVEGLFNLRGGGGVPAGGAVGGDSMGKKYERSTSTLPSYSFRKRTATLTIPDADKLTPDELLIKQSYNYINNEKYSLRFILRRNLTIQELTVFRNAMLFAGVLPRLDYDPSDFEIAMTYTDSIPFSLSSLPIGSQSQLDPDKFKQSLTIHSKLHQLGPAIKLLETYHPEALEQANQFKHKLHDSLKKLYKG